MRWLRIAIFLFYSVTALDLAQATERQESVLRSAASPELGAEASQSAQSLPYKYFGNNLTSIFHRPWCPFGSVISASHLNAFHFRRDAIQAGYRPCRYCLPPTWQSVRAVLMPSRSPNAADQSTIGSDEDLIRFDPPLANLTQSTLFKLD